MLNGEGNENGIKINRSNQQRNKLHVQHTFFLISKTQICTCSTHFGFLCHCFAQLQCCFVGLKRQTSQLHIILWRNCHIICAYPIFCLLCSCMIAFIFHCHSFSPCWLLAFLILTTTLNFHVFLPTKFVSFVFNHSLQLFLCYPHDCKHQK